MKIRKNYRIYPTTQQAAYLEQDCGNQRFLWNQFLELNKICYEAQCKFLYQYDIGKILLELKELYPFLKIGGSQALQQTLRDLDQAFKNFFKNKQHFGFPKFKKRHSGGSVRYLTGSKIKDTMLIVPKLDPIKIIDNGQGLPEKFSSVTITKKPSGKWYASFVVEFEPKDKIEINDDLRKVGIDLNSVDFAVLSNGTKYVNPKHLLKEEKKLKYLQRQASKKKLKSKNKNKLNRRVARLHEKVTNQRKDFVEQLTSDLVKNYDVLCIEDLNVKAMQQFNGRMIQSAPFGLFRSKLTWKANREGKHLVVISRWAPTSKTCSECGTIHDMPLDKRTMICECGNIMDRDVNAAINILTYGLLNFNTKSVSGTDSDTRTVDLGRRKSAKQKLVEASGCNTESVKQESTLSEVQSTEVVY